MVLVVVVAIVTVVVVVDECRYAVCHSTDASAALALKQARQDER